MWSKGGGGPGARGWDKEGYKSVWEDEAGRMGQRRKVTAATAPMLWLLPVFMPLPQPLPLCPLRLCPCCPCLTDGVPHACQAVLVSSVALEPVSKADVIKGTNVLGVGGEGARAGGGGGGAQTATNSLMRKSTYQI